MDKGNERQRRLTWGPREIATAALCVFGVVALGVTVIAIIESYSNLYAFALDHGLGGWRAAIAPAAVDSFIIMGELLLFAALLNQWQGKTPYVLGISMAAWGFALSVGGNIWHVPVTTVTDRAVAALWPVTATAGLAGSLIIVKWLLSGRKPRPAKAPAAAAPQAPPPAPGLPPREPRANRVRAARAPELAAARDTEIRRLAEALATGEQPWHGEAKLGRETGIGRRGAAAALALARTMSNGAGHDDRDGA